MNILVPEGRSGGRSGIKGRSGIASYLANIMYDAVFFCRAFVSMLFCTSPIIFFSRNPRNCPPSDPSEMTKSTLDCSTGSLCPSCTPMPVFFRVAYCTPLSLSNHNQFSQDPQTVLRKMPLFGPTFFLQSLLRSVTSQFCMIRHFFSAALISYPIN